MMVQRRHSDPAPPNWLGILLRVPALVYALCGMGGAAAGALGATWANSPARIRATQDTIKNRVTVLEQQRREDHGALLILILQGCAKMTPKEKEYVTINNAGFQCPPDSPHDSEP